MASAQHADTAPAPHAAGAPHASTGTAGHDAASGDRAHPVLPKDSTWAGVMVIVIIGGFFLPAAVIGPIVRTLSPEEEEEPHDAHGHDHGHDDAHAASHHHGHSTADDPHGHHGH